MSDFFHPVLRLLAIIFTPSALSWGLLFRVRERVRVRDWLVLLIYTPVARGGIGIGIGGGMITWLQSRSVGRLATRAEMDRHDLRCDGGEVRQNSELVGQMTREMEAESPLPPSSLAQRTQLTGRQPRSCPPHRKF